MTAVRVVILCLAAALVCTTLRVQRPEIATAISMAAGIAALLMTSESLSVISGGVQRFTALAALDGETSSVVIRTAGIAVISELGVQICNDAGESALGGRIRLAARVTMIAMAMPVVLNVLDVLEEVFPDLL